MLWFACIVKMTVLSKTSLKLTVNETENTDLWEMIYSSIICKTIETFSLSFQPVLHDWCNKAVVCVILSVGWSI